jgi:uncharacterized protein YutE (UPF0331/DUF86 family)
LQRVGSARARQPELLPIDAEDIVLINLQRAIQAAMDLAMHIVAAEGYGLPDSAAAAFAALSAQGLLDPSLAESLQRMVGFRSIAVHEYQTLNSVIVEAIGEKHLDDLRAFAAFVASRYPP